jgi:subtilisin family serine protease
MPPDLTDWNDHGTQVACLAAGVQYGVAPNANLVLVKYRNAFRSRIGKVSTPLATVEAMADALHWIIQHIDTNNRAGISVINLSWGKLDLVLI